VLYNLVGNAIKFTEKGGVAISVAPAGRSPAMPPGGRRQRFLLRFDVADTGVGIPASVLPSLFEQFAQADPSVARRYGGSGLGLSISRRLAALMGGTIGVASEEGQGSQFWFTSALAPAEAAHRGPALPRLDRWRILFVAANPVSREIMTQQLAAWGAVLDTVAEPDRVLPLLRQAAAAGRGFAAAVLDHETPGLDPLALARAIGSTPELAGLRLVLATTPTASELRHAARDAGFAAVLIKPSAPSAIYAALAPQAALPAAAAERRERAPADGLRVLVAEDNKVSQVVVVKLLQKLGCRVDAVDDGRAAVEALRRAAYHLVLMDVQMPQMDGLAATAAIRALPQPERRDVWIVALTANAFAEDIRRCLAAGMNDFVAKPVRPADLEACLARIPASALATAAE
jgi:two-component system, sensor histidine kinase and response regulator